MIVTCGSFLLTPNNNILLCLPTNSITGWTVPKGLPDFGESFYKAAVRELKEETGISIDKYRHQTKELGIEKYPLRDKMIKGFLFILDEDIEGIPLVCNSFFTCRNTGNMLPEISKHKWMKVSESLNIMRQEQRKLIKWCLR